MTVRLQKFLAEAGVASRRASEKLITDGHITVNGREVVELGTKVDPLHDRVMVDGRLVKAKRKLYIALHKPPAYLCSRTDESASGRRLVGDLLPKEWSNLFSVGRLDNDSEGLLLLTNDGDFSLHLTHPRYGVVKTYVVTVEGKIDLHVINLLMKGIEDKGQTLKAKRARLISATKSKSVVEMELTEGKNRQVRKMTASIGHPTLRLVRMRIGNFELGGLSAGEWKELSKAERALVLAERVEQ